MKKAIKYIHLILSLPAGIVLTIVCLTGAILVFDDEINQLFYPSRYYVQNTTASPIRLGKDKATVLPFTALHERATDIYNFHPETIKITSDSYYGDDDQREMNGWAYVLHTGSWGGFITKLLTFFAALFGSTLPIAGSWMFIRRIRKKRR